MQTDLTTGYFGVSALAPRMTWKLDGRRRFDHDYIARSVAYVLRSSDFERKSVSVHASDERVLMEPFERRIRSYPTAPMVIALDRSVAVFALEPIAGVILDRPIVNAESLQTRSAEEFETIGDCVIPGGIVVGSRFGDARPTHWFAIGITDGVVPLDQAFDRAILGVGDAAFVLERGSDGWQVRPHNAPQAEG